MSSTNDANDGSPRSEDVGSSSSNPVAGDAGEAIRPQGVSTRRRSSTRSQDEGLGSITSSKSKGGSKAGSKPRETPRRTGGRKATKVTTSYQLPKGNFPIEAPPRDASTFANWDVEGAVELARRQNPTVPPIYNPPLLDLSELRGQPEDVVQEHIRGVKEDTTDAMRTHSEELRRYESWEALERLN